ncbi:uncharacterized protein GJ701_014330 isoform 1-T1 [Geothlypis trichas]
MACLSLLALCKAKLSSREGQRVKRFPRTPHVSSNKELVQNTQNAGMGQQVAVDGSGCRERGRSQDARGDPEQAHRSDSYRVLFLTHHTERKVGWQPTKVDLILCMLKKQILCLILDEIGSGMLL